MKKIDELKKLLEAGRGKVEDSKYSSLYAALTKDDASLYTTVEDFLKKYKDINSLVNADILRYVDTSKYKVTDGKGILFRGYSGSERAGTLWPEHHYDLVYKTRTEGIAKLRKMVLKSIQLAVDTKQQAMDAVEAAQNAKDVQKQKKEDKAHVALGIAATHAADVFAHVKELQKVLSSKE